VASIAIRCAPPILISSKPGSLRWLSLLLLADIPWAGRVWALPFLTVLAPPERYWQQQGCNPKLLVVANGEPLFEEMEAEKHLPPPTDPLIRCIQAGKVGHTFRALWAQQMLHNLIDQEIISMKGERDILNIAVKAS
jgi:hypothetical protein